MAKKTERKMRLFDRIFRRFLRRAYENDTPQQMRREDELEDNYLISIQGSYIYRTGSVDIDEGTAMASVPERGNEESKKPPMKKPVKPVDIINELELPPREIDLMGLDDKIAILKIKKELINQRYALQDIDGLIIRMENRKKYPKYKEFFSGFSTTTDKKINALLNKYDLVFRSVDIFVPELPDEVILVMKKYQDITIEICGKKPLIKIIATSASFKEVNDSRDPIILAESPFWFGYDILGAYDKEMLLLSEL